MDGFYLSLARGRHTRATGRQIPKVRRMREGFLVGAAMAGIFLASAPNASAAVACVGPVCWHSHERYEYPPDANVTVHPDDWRWGKDEHYSWREHEGRGY